MKRAQTPGLKVRLGAEGMGDEDWCEEGGGRGKNGANVGFKVR